MQLRWRNHLCLSRFNCAFRISKIRIWSWDVKIRDVPWTVQGGEYIVLNSSSQVGLLMWMLGRKLELRSTEILLGYQVQQGQQGQVQQLQQGQQGQVQQGQVRQVQEQQVQQEHQGHCSISFKNSKCSKDNEIEWSKDSKIKFSKNTLTGQSDDKSKCRTTCAIVVAGCFVLGFAAETVAFRRENWRGREPW